MMRHLRDRLVGTRMGRQLKRGRNCLRHLWIRSVQAAVLRTLPSETKRLVIFLTPGYDWRTGGVLAIGTHYRESIGLTDIHAAQVVLCAVPNDPLFLKYTWFRNANYILRLDAVLGRCPALAWLLIHVPEYAVNQFVAGLRPEDKALLRRCGAVHLNVMLQNIQLIQDQNLAGLAEFGRVTCTTAHEAYSTLGVRRSLGVPLHKLSVKIDAEQYIQRPYERKRSLLVVSPDPHPLKDRVLKRIAAAHPGLTIQVIRDLSYEAYKRLVSRAKWSLTFGEGLDGYFCEPIFSGGVGFAVFNDRFFTPEYASLETVYPSWEALEERIVDDLRRLDEPSAYRRCSSQARELLLRKYNNAEYRENLCRFYRGEYSFP
jgi:hypothetical protein